MPPPFGTRYFPSSRALVPDTHVLRILLSSPFVRKCFVIVDDSPIFGEPAAQVAFRSSSKWIHLIPCSCFRIFSEFVLSRPFVPIERILQRTVVPLPCLSSMQLLLSCRRRRRAPFSKHSDRQRPPKDARAHALERAAVRIKNNAQPAATTSPQFRFIPGI